MKNTYISILANHINAHGRIDDAIICREIAQFINSRPFSEAPLLMNELLYDFIDQYGEDEDCNYLGRDEHGEKQYITYNEDTHWHGRIRRELVALGYYQRWQNLQEEKELELLQVS